MDNLKNFRRTNYCGDLRLGDTGKTVSLCGWVQRQRDLGGLIFVDLRDRTGLVQLSFDDGTDQAVFEKASSLRSEYVIAATGTVRERESKTDKIATGAIEVYVTELRLLAKAETPPFEIVEHSKANDMESRHGRDGHGGEGHPAARHRQRTGAAQRSGLRYGAWLLIQYRAASACHRKGSAGRARPQRHQ